MLAFEHSLERGEEVGGLDVGEVAELSDVHPQDSHALGSEQVDRAQHRAVAAQAHGEIATVGHRWFVDPEFVASDQHGIGAR